MNKHDLIQKIKALDGISQDERAYLIDLVNTKKKYGLVWEDKPEAVEEQLRENLPVLQEVVEKRILGKELPQATIAQGTQLSLETETPIPENEEYPNHILIEGDNLHALTALTFTHENKIDVIYIDPPYNTGNKDFKYNDKFIDKDDSFKHSKYLSFIAKRLAIAKKLLTVNGKLFISIDDNEQAQLKMLCDEIFGEENFLANIIWQKVYSPRMDSKSFSVSHDYILCFRKNNSSNINKLLFEQNSKQFNQFDSVTGKYYRARSLRKDGSNSLRIDRPNLFYGISAPDGTEVFPIKPDGKEGNWRWSLDTFKENFKNGNVIWNKKGDKWDILVKQWKLDDPYMPPPTIWLNNEVGHNHEAAEEIKEIFKLSSFSTPKPTRLLNRIIQLGGNPESIILDFFAGSGTTLHAAMQLNQEDGGNRQCILVTNNENNICEEVTYERNKRVIQGYINAKGMAIEGLTKNNLRYYKTGFVKSQKSQENKRQLTALSTQLLCIKEDCYYDLTQQFGFNETQARIFTNKQGKYLVVVYYSRQQLQVYESLIEIIQNLSDATEKIKLYAFSPEKETLVEDFIEVADKIEAVPLPDAIYNAYRATFRAIKLDKKAPTTFASEESSETEQETEESQN